MSDDMFFSPDSRSLKRGRRAAKRTPTCRPCLLWPPDAPEIRWQGVVLDISPFGMLIRMMDSLHEGADMHVQLMRDEQFSEPLAKPFEVKVVRCVPAQGLFTDHGMRVLHERPAPAARRPARAAGRR